MEDEAIGGFGSQQKRNSSENQPATNSTVPFKQPNTASSTHLNGSSVQGPHQPSRLGPSISNPRLNGPPLTDPSKVKMMLSPTGSAGKPQLGVNRPSMMSPPAVSAPSQNAGSSPILPSTPAIPTSSQYADRSAVPTPPPVPQAGTQEMELSLPMPTSSQPKNAPTVSVIPPPAHGIKNDLSGSISYAVDSSSTFHALPGTTSMNPKLEHSPLFCSDSVVPSSIMPRGKELSLNQNNIHSQPSNAPDGSTLLPPPPPVPPVGAEVSQAENQKSSNLPLEDPTLIDRHNLSESIVPTAPKLLPSHSNGNTIEVDTQTSADGNNADGSNGEVSNEDSSKSDDDTLSDDSKDYSPSCGPSCVCY